MIHPASSSRGQALALPACILFASLALAGCGGEDVQGVATAAPTAPSAPEGPVDGPPMSGVSSRGTFQIEVTPKGGPVPTNEPFAVHVKVTDPETGDPFTAFDEITLDARMPGHDHGMTRDVELVAAGPPGEFVAEGLLFHMIGYWEFHVDVVQGPRMERAQVDTTLQF